VAGDEGVQGSRLVGFSARGVAAGGAQGAVSQQFGDQDGVFAIADELGGEGVAQDMPG
jgi:hypothetical protein